MTGRTVKRIGAVGLLSAAMSLGQAIPTRAQKLERGTSAVGLTRPLAPGDQPPDAQRTKNEFRNLLNRYPPSLREIFKEDPNLMTLEQYLKPYPALASYLSEHPEITLNPSFYLDGLGRDQFNRPPSPQQDHTAAVLNIWDNVTKGLLIFAGFGLAIGLITWLIRTFLDYRRWHRLSSVQADVHTKLLDRFSSSEEIMAYIATPAGSKFLQSAPISLDTGVSASRSMGAPLSRIMWSAQAGVVLFFAGIGLLFASGRAGEDAHLPLEIMGILAGALGVGFAVSAGVSFLLSHKMGLLEPVPQKRPADAPEAQ
jgi:hypothetical protein